MENTYKETQSQRKFKQYLEDLRRNERFLSQLKKVKDALELKNKEGRDIDDELFGGTPTKFYVELERAVVEMLKKTKGGTRGAINELAEEYGLSYWTILGLVFDFFLQENVIHVGQETDFCIIQDNHEEYFEENTLKVPFEFDIQKQTQMRAYPVSIDLHKFVTKRDILDFINKRWDIIEDLLMKSSGKKKRFRQRKLDRRLVDFIWEKRELPLKKIATALKVEFPKSGLMYYEIAKIINLEKRRRLGKLT